MAAMYSATTHIIRPATADDDGALECLAGLDSQRPITSPALIGERDGRAVAAISLAGAGVTAYPCVAPAELAAMLRVRSGALRAHTRQPSLRERIRAGLRP